MLNIIISAGSKKLLNKRLYRGIVRPNCVNTYSYNKKTLGTMNRKLSTYYLEQTK